MSTITKEFTKEQLIEKLQHRISVASGFPESEKAQMDLELARIALASLEAEAYGYVHKAAYETAGSCGLSNDHEAYRDSSTHIAVYTAPPTPVSVPDDMQMKPILKDGNQIAGYECMGERYSTTAGCTWNSATRMRAAMLQGAEQQSRQQNIPENIPATQFNPVADLYGLTSPTGSETSFTFDAVEARDFIDGGWSCQEYVELERFQEAVIGNSPVIPDGWVTWDELQKRHYLGEGKPVMVFGSTSDFCSKHPQTKRVVHPYMCTASMPPQPCYYCPECEPDVAEWEAKWGRK